MNKYGMIDALATCPFYHRSIPLKTLPKHFVKKTLIPVGAAILTTLSIRQTLPKSMAIGIGIAIIATTALSANAQINEQLIGIYAQSMQSAANNQNISQVAKLVADDAVISLTREGKGSSTLDKNTYLDLLQKSWTQTKNYRYEINISEVIITGEQARALVVTKENWTDKDGKTQTLITNSRATLSSNGKHAILLRSVSQVTLK